MARKVRMLVPHRAILINGETVEYEGAHPTHWTFGGVDKDGRMDGSPVQTVAVQAIIPGTWPEDDFESDPRDVEIERLRKIITELRATHDPRDAQIAQLRELAEGLLNQKKVAEVQLTPEEIAANEDALADYRSGKTVQDAVPVQTPPVKILDATPVPPVKPDGYTPILPPEIPPEQKELWEKFIAEHAKDAE